ncbi:MAG: hypothetical protein ACYC2O_13090, partial [Microthrixaceae bacterium]
MFRRAPRSLYLGVAGLLCLLAAAACTPPVTPGGSTTTTTLPSGPPPAQVSTGSLNTCVVSDGSVLCLGNNYYGQLGNGAAPGNQAPVLTPTEVTGVTTATQVAASTDHGCALLADSTVTCWGRNNYGQLGNG